MPYHCFYVEDQQRTRLFTVAHPVRALSCSHSPCTQSLQSRDPSCERWTQAAWTEDVPPYCSAPLSTPTTTMMGWQNYYWAAETRERKGGPCDAGLATCSHGCPLPLPPSPSNAVRPLYAPRSILLWSWDKNGGRLRSPLPPSYTTPPLPRTCARVNSSAGRAQAGRLGRTTSALLPFMLIISSLGAPVGVWVEGGGEPLIWGWCVVATGPVTCLSLHHKR